MPRLPSNRTKKHAMESYYANRSLPQPAIPTLKSLDLPKDKTARLTGANSGIGPAIVVALGRAGANVIVRRGQPCRHRAGGRRNSRRRAERDHRTGRIADEAQVQAVFAAAEQEFGTVGILVSTHGMGRNAPFHEMSVARWTR